MTDLEIERAILDLLVPGRERKVAFVIAKVAEAAGNDDEEFLPRVEAMIKHLVATNKLEAWGDVSQWRHSEVRLIA